MLTAPGWRGGHGNRQALGGFILGLMAGGVTAGMVLWVLAGLATVVPATAATALVVMAVAGGIVHEFGVHRFRLPENRRLIPIEVFARHPVVAGGQFGFELGTGVRTYLPSVTPYVLAAAVGLLGAGGAAPLLAGLGFGLGRALMPISRNLAGGSEEWDLELARLAKTIGRTSILLVAVGLFAVLLR